MMTGTKKKQSGIRDMDLKLKVCCGLLNAYNPTHLAQDVLNEPGYKDLAVKAADTFRKWRDGRRPTKADGAGMFWDVLARRLGCDPAVTGVMLIDATIEGFIEYLPEDLKKLAYAIVSGERLGNKEIDILVEVPTPTPAALTPRHLNTIWLDHLDPVETIAADLRDGKIDQKHFYLSPGSANDWSRLVEAEGYPTYGHCKTGLQALFDCDPWKQMLRESRPVTAVMLAGGGAPTKDILLLRSLLGTPHAGGQVFYYLVDISMYMLRESALWIGKHLRTVKGFEKVAFQPIHQDVLALTSLHRELFHHHGKAIFAITGGTIGNFREETFFRSLDRAAEDGDLLIVSADTIDGLAPDVIKRTLVDKYDNPGLRQFIQPVVGDILSESNIHESIPSAAKRTKVRLEPGVEAKASDVRKSQSVIVTLDVNGREITLATSTRYESSELIAFAARFGWQAVCQMPSPMNQHFKQFLFRRKKAETTGHSSAR